MKAFTHKKHLRLTLAAAAMLCLLILFTWSVSAGSGAQVFSESFDGIDDPLQLYGEWYAADWSSLRSRDGALGIATTLLRRDNYVNYAFSGEIKSERGNISGSSKGYILFRNPAGFGAGKKELALTELDNGASGNDGRPGYLGFMAGVAESKLELVVHTLDIDRLSGYGNVRVDIDLPNGADFKDGVSFSVEDRGTEVSFTFGGSLVCMLRLSNPAERQAGIWNGIAYTGFEVLDAAGNAVLSGSDAIVPETGTVGFCFKGVVGSVDNVELSALSGNASGSVVKASVIDEASIVLRRAVKFEKRTGSRIETAEICVLVIALAIAVGIAAVALLLAKKKAVRIGACAGAGVIAAAALVLILTGVVNLSGKRTAALQQVSVPEGDDGSLYVLDANGNTPMVRLTDDIAAVDAIGRKLPTYEETGPTKENKYVGVFYTLWTCLANSLSDNTKLIAQDPDHPGHGSEAMFHWFTEPETGYATSLDEWVVQRNLRYLSLAGVDYIYLDFTNGGIYEDAFTLLLDTSLAMRAEGNSTPCIVPWVFGSDTGTMEDAGYLYRKFYSQEKYRELWFYVQGKPLILLKRVEENIAQNTYPKTYLPVLYNEGFREFFTTRFAWVPSETEYGTYPGEPVYRWSWCNPLFMHGYKEDAIAYSWDTSPEIAEQVTIIGGSYCRIGYGRSGEEGTLDKFREKETSGLGLYLEDQFEWVMENHPEVTYLQISGWNEWIAQYFASEDGGTGFGFVDSYNREFSRDLAPIKNGYGDNYFYQLQSIIRRFKGMDPPAGSDDGQSEYRDFAGDTVWRDSTDTTGTIQYIDRTGRNDIVSCKVECGGSNIVFAAVTADELKGRGEGNWMLLFIDADCDESTGFMGYDYLINYEVIDDSRTVLCRYNDDVWQEIGLVEYTAEGNTLSVTVPRSLIGKAEQEVRFGFHWLDNVTDVYSFSDWCLTGDSAPERRGRYVFETSKKYEQSGEKIKPARTGNLIQYMPAMSSEAAAETGALCRTVYALAKDYGKQPELDLLKQGNSKNVDSFEVGDINSQSFALSFDGCIRVDNDGMYDFTLRSDDGSILFIDGREIVNISGVHTVTEGKGSLPLAAGYHRIRIEYFENGNGGSTLEFSGVSQGEGISVNVITG